MQGRARAGGLGDGAEIADTGKGAAASDSKEGVKRPELCFQKITLAAVGIKGQHYSGKK